MTAPAKLQLKLLSKSGELINSIACHGGRVSVFRAVMPRNLDPFLRALSGLSGPEKFTVSLDNANFEPSEHILIGFGESFAVSTEAVHQFVANAGLDLRQFLSTLANFGLEHIVGKACQELTNCEERRLRLLAAAYGDASKVMVLNNPFEPLADGWRERFADLLTEIARTRARLIVVPATSYRPQCWINNELIERIQVDQVSQKTIGFTNSPSAANEMVAHIRQLMKDEEAVKRVLAGDEAAALPAEAPQRTVQNPPPVVMTHRPVTASTENLAELVDIPLLARLQNRRNQLYLGTGFLATLTLLVAIAMSSSQPASTTEALLPPPQPVANLIPPTMPVTAPPPPEPKPVEVVQHVEAPLPPAPQPVHILDSYPAPIRKAILDTFEGTVVRPPSVLSDGLPTQDAFAPPVGGTVPPPEKNFLGLLNSLSNNEATPDTGERPAPPLPFGRPQEDLGSMDEEARRDAIRNKFLEAIQRAAQQREQPNM